MSYTNENKEDGTAGGDSFDIGSLVGFTLGAALRTALAEGYCIENISITSPPKLQISEYDNTFRVLRVELLADRRLSMLVCKPL